MILFQSDPYQLLHHFNIAMTRPYTSLRAFFLCFSAACFMTLAACGGGGGSSDTPVQVSGMTADNSGHAATLGAGIGELFLAMGKVQSDALNSLSMDKQSSLSRACTNGGSFQISTDSFDANFKPGDKFTIKYKNCLLDEPGSYISGNVHLQLKELSLQKINFDANYDENFKIKDVHDGSESTINGGHGVYLQNLQKNKIIEISSTSVDNLTLSGFFVNNRGLTEKFSESLKEIKLRKSISRISAKYDLSLEFKWDSTVIGGSLIVQTPKSFRGYFDSYPTEGELSVSDRSNKQAKLTPNDVGDYGIFNVNYYSNGLLQSDAQKNGSWSNLSNGYFWWSENFGRNSIFIPGNVNQIGVNDFRLIQSPSINPQAQSSMFTLSYQFTRPLSINSTINYSFVKAVGDQPVSFLWSRNAIPAKIQIDGAYLTLTPETPLQHNVTYSLIRVDSSGQQIYEKLTDSFGHYLSESDATMGATFIVDSSLLAQPSLKMQAPLLTNSYSLNLISDASKSVHGITFYEWSQIDGPTLVFGSPTQASTTVALASGGNLRTQANVQLKIVDSIGQVEYGKITIFIDPNPTASAYLYYRSEPGDYIGAGQTFFARSDSMGGGVVSSTNQLNFFVQNTTISTGASMLILSDKDGLPLKAGFYSGATRGFDKNTNGLDFSTDGRGCNMTSGNFEIKEISVDESYSVTKLAVDFEQHCEGFNAALFGSIRFRSGIPIRP
jgi:hypothetical protein